MDVTEVILNKSKIISASPKSIKNIVKPPTPTAIKLEDLHTLPDYSIVSVTIKVIRVDNPTQVKPDLCKQDLYIADATGSARLTLWQESINCLELEQCYAINSLVVNTFNHKKYLTTPKSGFSHKLIEDIGDVQSTTEPEEPNNELHNVHVGGIQYIKKYRSCLSCEREVDEISSVIGRCTKCKMAQCLNRCHSNLSARLLIIYNDSDKLTLTAFLPSLQQIADDSTLSYATETNEWEFQLLLASPFTVTYSPSYIIQSVSRP